MKFPGVISLRNDRPIWAIPNGTFFRLTCWIVAKSTNIACAVSGRRKTVFSASSIGPMFVLNIRWKFFGCVNAVCPQFGHFGACSMSGGVVLLVSGLRRWKRAGDRHGSADDSSGTRPADR